MLNPPFEDYNEGKDDDIRFEYPNGYGKHKNKVVLTVYNDEPVAEVWLNDVEFTLIDVTCLYLLETTPFIAHKRNDGQSCARANGISRAYIHRMILNPANQYQVDHINHNPLDNRLVNLRVCSAKQNHLAKKDSRVNEKLNSGFLGVYRTSMTLDDLPVYRVRHPIEGHFSEYFLCPIKAAKFRDEAYERNFSGLYDGGEWFTLNFIKWNFPPSPTGGIFAEALNYISLREYECQGVFDEGIEWLSENLWTRPFYNTYKKKYSIKKVINLTLDRVTHHILS
jgi:hypothetical protein